MIYLKQSTASQEVLLGPFVDSTDGVTAETALTIANTDIKLWLAGATTLGNKNSGGATHISGGNYYAVLDATDTATLGSGAIIVQMSGALAVRHDFVVLAANVYDSLIGGGDLLDVNTAQWLGTACATPDTAGYVKTTIKVGTGTGEINLASGNVPIRTGIKKGAGIANFPFVMQDSTGAPLTGSTVTVYRALDGAGSFTSVGTATEMASGWYQIDLAAGDTNGDTIALRFVGSGGSGTPADGGVTIVTEP